MYRTPAWARDKGEPSHSVRNRVVTARKKQQERFSGGGIFCNSEMAHSQIERFCALSPEGERFLGLAVERLALSARSYHRALKVARTVADLAGSKRVEVEHLAEAIQYRCLERSPFS